MMINEDRLSIQIEPCFEKSYSPMDRVSRDLIAAIIYQAVMDYIRNGVGSKSAKSFLNYKNMNFVHCCELIDLNPIAVTQKVNKMVIKIRRKSKEITINDNH